MRSGCASLKKGRRKISELASGSPLAARKKVAEEKVTKRKSVQE